MRGGCQGGHHDPGHQPHHHDDCCGQDLQQKLLTGVTSKRNGRTTTQRAENLVNCLSSQKITAENN